MTETPPQVVRSYLAELDSALVGTTEEVRREILTGVREQLIGVDAATAAHRIDVGLVWASGSWLRWEKWVATLVTPGLMALTLAASWAASLGPADGGSPVIGGLASWHIVLLLPLVINVGVGLWLIVRARSPK